MQKCSVHKNLVPLKLPPADLKLARKGTELVVWDDIRKKYLLLTPEEWVRQHFVHFLIQLGYPKTAIALESGFYLNRKLQRSDILIYKNSRPALLVECKAPQVKINQETFDQASRYNLQINADFIAITNGLQHFAVKVEREEQTYRFLKDIPGYNAI